MYSCFIARVENEYSNTVQLQGSQLGASLLLNIVVDLEPALEVLILV